MNDFELVHAQIVDHEPTEYLYLTGPLITYLQRHTKHIIFNQTANAIGQVITEIKRQMGEV